MRLAVEVENRMEAGSEPEYFKAVDAFNTLAEQKLDANKCDMTDFENDAVSAAKKALTPRPPYIERIEEADHLEIIRLLREEDLEDYQFVYLYDLLCIRLGMHFLPLGAGTPQQILEKAREYKPIAL